MRPGQRHTEETTGPRSGKDQKEPTKKQREDDAEYRRRIYLVNLSNAHGFSVTYPVWDVEEALQRGQEYTTGSVRVECWEEGRGVVRVVNFSMGFESFWFDATAAED